MKKWEYRIVIAAHTGGPNNRLAPQIVDNEVLKNWRKGPSIYDYLNHLGDKGWELVTITSPDRYVFKRRKK